MSDRSTGPPRDDPDVAAFESHRAELLALAYRMLGDLPTAEDVVQDAWLRWTRRRESVHDVGAYLATTTARLCLNRIQSARARREVERPNALPEPIDLSLSPFERVARLEDLSMAVLVALRRLTPAERAALLLHDVFGIPHAEIAELIDKTEGACRQLVRRARLQVREGRRSIEVSDAEHRRLLHAFAEAALRGDIDRLADVLAEDVIMITDSGLEGGSFGGVRNLPRPLHGRRVVAGFVAKVTPVGARDLEFHERRLNGQPTFLLTQRARAFAVFSVSVSDGRIDHVFIQSDPDKLARLQS